MKKIHYNKGWASKKYRNKVVMKRRMPRSLPYFRTKAKKDKTTLYMIYVFLFLPSFQCSVGLHVPLYMDPYLK